MFENRYEARTELINKNRLTIDKPLAKAGNENINVSISFWSPLNLLNIRNNLVTLKTLKIRAICGRIDKALDWLLLVPVLASIISKTDAITTKKSNIFHPDKKYALPKALNFKTISQINIILNTKLMLDSIVSLRMLSSSSVAIITEIFTSIQIVIPSSNGLHVAML